MEVDRKKIEEDFNVNIEQPLTTDLTCTIGNDHRYNLIGLDDKGREIFYRDEGDMLIVETRTPG